MPTPPTPEFLKTYLVVAARRQSADDETLAAAAQLVIELQSPEYKEQHYCIKPYFDAWYRGGRAKKAARLIARDVIPDVRARLGEMNAALNAAAIISSNGEADPMELFLHGSITERRARRPTGISGLDQCMNGGWDDGECSLLFGGTGAGKSIAAGQCAWWEAFNNKGWPLINRDTTEGVCCAHRLQCVHGSLQRRAGL